MKRILIHNGFSELVREEIPGRNLEISLMESQQRYTSRENSGSVNESWNLGILEESRGKCAVDAGKIPN